MNRVHADKSGVFVVNYVTPTMSSFERAIYSVVKEQTKCMISVSAAMEALAVRCVVSMEPPV